MQAEAVMTLGGIDEDQGNRSASSHHLFCRTQKVSERLLAFDNPAMAGVSSHAGKGALPNHAASTEVQTSKCNSENGNEKHEPK